MDEYEIILTPDAEEDLLELRNYIAGVLFSPDTALEYVRAIQKEIASLAQFPARSAPGIGAERIVIRRKTSLYGKMNQTGRFATICNSILRLLAKPKQQNSY